mmetsp:Transcript_24628/g.69293  ORF Transcript_24628/g.69293 Transcript_24628/m.69293 type:complete len:212 (-) Transcript_24628:162-797(-)
MARVRKHRPVDCALHRVGAFQSRQDLGRGGRVPGPDPRCSLPDRRSSGRTTTRPPGRPVLGAGTTGGGPGPRPHAVAPLQHRLGLCVCLALGRFLEQIGRAKRIPLSTGGLGRFGRSRPSPQRDRRRQTGSRRARLRRLCRSRSSLQLDRRRGHRRRGTGRSFPPPAPGGRRLVRGPRYSPWARTGLAQQHRSEVGLFPLSQHNFLAGEDG